MANPQGLTTGMGDSEGSKSSKCEQEGSDEAEERAEGDEDEDGDVSSVEGAEEDWSALVLELELVLVPEEKGSAYEAREVSMASVGRKSVPEEEEEEEEGGLWIWMVLALTAVRNCLSC
jgi:hypothetical protein